MIDPGKDSIEIEELYKEINEKKYQPITKPIFCSGCRKPLDKKTNDFISVLGNIMQGFNGGLIGNNFTKDGKLFRATFFCIPCFKEWACSINMGDEEENNNGSKE